MLSSSLLVSPIYGMWQIVVGCINIRFYLCSVHFDYLLVKCTSQGEVNWLRDTIYWYYWTSSFEMLICFLVRFLKYFWHTVGVCIRSYTIYCSLCKAILWRFHTFQRHNLYFHKICFYGLTQSYLSKRLPVWWESVCNPFCISLLFPLDVLFSSFSLLLMQFPGDYFIIVMNQTSDAYGFLKWNYCC
jgi:hypothetical protein